MFKCRRLRVKVELQAQQQSCEPSTFHSLVLPVLLIKTSNLKITYQTHNKRKVLCTFIWVRCFPAVNSTGLQSTTISSIQLYYNYYFVNKIITLRVQYKHFNTILSSQLVLYFDYSELSLDTFSPFTNRKANQLSLAVIIKIKEISTSFTGHVNCIHMQVLQ